MLTYRNNTKRTFSATVTLNRNKHLLSFCLCIATNFAVKDKKTKQHSNSV